MTKPIFIFTTRLLGKDDYFFSEPCPNNTITTISNLDAFTSKNIAIGFQKPVEMYIQELDLEKVKAKYRGLSGDTAYDLIVKNNENDDDLENELKSELLLIKNDIKETSANYKTIAELVSSETGKIKNDMDLRQYIFKSENSEMYAYRCLDHSDIINHKNSKRFITALTKDIAKFKYPDVDENSLLDKFFKENTIYYILHGQDIGSDKAFEEDLSSFRLTDNDVAEYLDKSNIDKVENDKHKVFVFKHEPNIIFQFLNKQNTGQINEDTLYKVLNDFSDKRKIFKEEEASILNSGNGETLNKSYFLDNNLNLY